MFKLAHEAKASFVPLLPTHREAATRGIMPRNVDIRLYNLCFYSVLYTNRIKTGTTNPTAKPVVLKEAAATAWVDGSDGLGATVGHFCMDLAIRKAKECGIGLVSAKGI